MKKHLTSKEFDEYVEALSAFYPTPKQREILEKYQDLIFEYPQYQRIVRRKLNVLEAPDLAFENTKVSVRDIIEHRLKNIELFVEDTKNSLSQILTMGTYKLSLSRGEDTDPTQISIGYLSEELYFYVHHQLLEEYDFSIIVDGHHRTPDEIIPELGYAYVLFKHIYPEMTFEIVIEKK